MENKTLEDYIVNQLNSIDALRSELNDLQIDYRRNIEDYEELKKEIFKLFNLDGLPTSKYEEDIINSCKLEENNSLFIPCDLPYRINKNKTPTIFKYILRQWNTLKIAMKDEQSPEEDESEIIDYE